MSFRRVWILPLCLGLVLASACLGRERHLWDAGWRFQLGDVPEATDERFSDEKWRSVRLPHDWSIELAIDEHAPAGGHGGFFQNGLGWYRRTFEAPAAWRGKVAMLEFEGAHMNAEVWINGVSVARQIYGYTPFYADLTPHLRFDGPNVLAVRVDNSAQPNSRWFTGSGLYRHVWLHLTAATRVAPDGVFVRTTQLGADFAEVQAEITLAVAADAARDELRVETAILDPHGARVAEQIARADESARFLSKLSVPRPLAWSPETPHLYRLVTRVTDGKQVIDEVTTVFGIRTVRVSAAGGFELNGRRVVLNGGNVHHDTGPLGAASFDRAEERKVELLKAAGFNAVRTAHNPPSRAFLEACDRLGLLVMDEIFDGWAKGKNKHDYSVHFAEWWRHDVEAWVKRDRNHPSVVMWSAGNEMFERGSAAGQRIARELAERIRELDPTRPVTAGVNGLGKNGRWEQLDPLFIAFDVAGYNYELGHHAADHARLPERVIVAAESYQSEVFANWAASQDHPYVIGDFVWSALDYLGESGIGRVYRSDETPLKHWEGSMWPWHGAYCGDIDLIGWRKPVSHYRAIVWDRGEKLYAAVVAPSPDGKPWNVTPWSMPPALPSWTWPGSEGRPLTVEVYSRHERVRLELNGRVVGEAPTGRAEEFRAQFEVPYSAGELVAVGVSGGRDAERFVLTTAGAPAALRVRADRERFASGGQDLAFLTVEVVDAAGRWVPQAQVPVTVTVEGAAEFAAFGTGDLTSLEGYRNPTRTTFQGRALAIIRSVEHAGDVRVRLKAATLPETVVVLNTR